MRLAMTILVRDAEDLIETNLRYHRAQGVDLFLIGDNGSTDRTLEILEPYREAGTGRARTTSRATPARCGRRAERCSPARPTSGAPTG